jgi:hypothetical protein
VVSGQGKDQGTTSGAGRSKSAQLDSAYQNQLKSISTWYDLFFLDVQWTHIPLLSVEETGSLRSSSSAPTPRFSPYEWDPDRTRAGCTREGSFVTELPFRVHLACNLSLDMTYVAL